MRRILNHRWFLGMGLLGFAGLSSCATPAVVFVSPDYGAQHIMRVTMQGFSDAPGQQLANAHARSIAVAGRKAEPRRGEDAFGRPAIRAAAARTRAARNCATT